MKATKRPKPAADPRQAGRSSVWIALAVLTILTIVVYWNSLNGDFVFDDQQIVMQNPVLLNIHSFGDVAKLAVGWRQVLFLSYGLNFFWGGLNTYSYHVVNVALHVVNVWLVYFIILEIASPLTTSPPSYAAFTGAAVFSVHTLLSSAVSYIAGRSSVLCGVFYFLAILAFLKGTQKDLRASKRAMYFIVVALSGLFAWQTKQEAITLPVLMAALVWLRSEKREWRYIAALAVLPLILAATMWKQLQELFGTVMGNKVLINAGFDPVLQPAVYFRTYITAIVDYFVPRFVFPSGLSADPYTPPVEHWYSPEFIFSVLVLATLAYVMLRPKKSDPLLTCGIAAILLSPLTAYAVIPLADVVLEHRAYIPGLGVALVAAALFRWLTASFDFARIAAPALVVIVFAGMTIQRNPVFANNIALWQDAVDKSPTKSRAHFNLGAAFQNSQRPGDAIREYQIALKLKPDIHAAYSNIAAIQIDTAQLDAAEKTLVELTQIAPDYTEGFINLAVLYIRKQEPDKSVIAADRAIQLNPDAFAAHFNRAEALTQKGDFKAAVASYERAMYLRPDLESFRLNLGAAYVRVGDFKMAEKTFMEMTKGSMAAEAWRNLGNMYDSVDNDDRAVECLTKAVQLKPAYPDAHHDLGVIYMKKHLTDQAISEFGLTISQQPDFGPGVLNLSLAYQTKGDFAGARQPLEAYLSKYSNSRSKYLDQIKARLESLRQQR